MENNLFRQKSIDRISSPEELHDYMRVTSPRLWMILGAIAVLLAGFIVYASTTRMENTMKIRLQVAYFNDSADPVEKEEEASIKQVFFEVPFSQMDLVKHGMEVRVGNDRGTVSGLTTWGEKGIVYVEVAMEHGSEIFRNDARTYDDAELVLESTTPISFLWN